MTASQVLRMAVNATEVPDLLRAEGFEPALGQLNLLTREPLLQKALVQISGTLKPFLLLVVTLQLRVSISPATVDHCTASAFSESPSVLTRVKHDAADICRLHSCGGRQTRPSR